ncbi:MAG: Cupin domain [Bacteroidota bacterium]|jgi:quercetin dioxygenase-like cupin family protein|nr:Cupin domain [Bacteroidota bacterium]
MNSQKILTDSQWSHGKIKGFSHKELIDRLNGSVKLVKIDPSSEYPEHVHPDKTEYAYVIEGSVWITIGDRHLEATEGDFHIFPENIKHSLANKSIQNCLVLIGSIKN